jgi:hypothetical protein
MAPSFNKTPRAFVIMPFTDEFTAVFEQLIRGALTNYEVQRADSQLDERNILEAIIHGIAEADLIVADITGLNANVMYELGVAHALGKPTVMLTQTLADLPFDIRSYPAHLYSTHFTRATDLTERLRELGEQHYAGRIKFSNPVSDFLVTKSTRVVVATTHEYEPRMNVATDEPQITLSEASQEFREVFEVLAIETGLIAEHLSHAVEEVERARQSKFTSERVPAIQDALGGHLTAYAKALRAQQPRLHATWRRYTDRMLDSLTNPARIKEGALDRTSAVANLDAAVDNALTHLINFRARIANLVIASPEMVASTSEACAALDGIINELVLGKAYVARISDSIARVSGSA